MIKVDEFFVQYIFMLDYQIVKVLLKSFLSKEKIDDSFFEKNINWPHVREICDYHRVTLFLYSVLAQSNSLFSIKKDLHGLYKSHFVQAIRRVNHLAKIISDLGKAGIRIIPFKGYVLGYRLYDRIALRPTTDFDFFVKVKDAIKTIGILRETGFSIHTPDDIETKKLVKYFYSIELSRDKPKELIDLQWDLSNGDVPKIFDEDELFSCTQNIKIENKNITIFNDDVTLSLLVIHGAKNLWWNLGSVLDLAMFFQKFPQKSYESVMDRLSKNGILTMLLVGSELAKRYFDASLPHEVSQKIDQRACRIADYIESTLSQNPLAHPPTGWAKMKLNLQMREKLSERLRYMIFKMRPKRIDYFNRNKLFGSLYLAHIKRVIRQIIKPQMRVS